MSAPTRILLFGGSFDPVHHGHLLLARDVLEQRGFDRVLWIPNNRSPLKPDITPASTEHRLAMLRLALAPEPAFGLSTHETDQTQPCYTIDTVTALQRLQPDAEFSWLIGADSLATLHCWHRIADLLDALPFVVVARPGSIAPRIQLPEPWPERLASAILDQRRIDISSSDIRRRRAAGKSVNYLVPTSVASYIEEHDLYPRT